MIAAFNRRPVRDGAAGQIVESFANRRERAGFPGLRLDGSSEFRGAEGADEVLVITRWQSWDAFDAWVGSEEFCIPSTPAVPRLTVTAVK